MHEDSKILIWNGIVGKSRKRPFLGERAKIRLSEDCVSVRKTGYLFEIGTPLFVIWSVWAVLVFSLPGDKPNTIIIGTRESIPILVVSVICSFFLLDFRGISWNRHGHNIIIRYGSFFLPRTLVLCPWNNSG